MTTMELTMDESGGEGSEDPGTSLASCLAWLACGVTSGKFSCCGSASIPDFEEKYEFDDCDPLGSGAYAVVRKAKIKERVGAKFREENMKAIEKYGPYVAVKVVDAAKMSKKWVNTVL